MINRDGYLSSLWQSTTEQYVHHNKKPPLKQYDVIVVGGGITGVTTADMLLREGQTCLLLEAKQLCFGTTGGTTAHINTLLDVPYTEMIGNFGLDNAQTIYDACRHGVDTIRENTRELGGDCGWEDCRAFLFAETEDEQKELNDITEACRQVGLDPRHVEGIPVEIPFLSAISVANQARFHPTRYVHALAHRFEDMGGTIIEDCRVTKLNESSERIEAVTTKGTFSAKWIILATHIPPTINVLHMRCTPLRSYAMAIRIHEDQYFRDLVYDMRNPYNYFRMQKVDGENYLIAGGRDHRTGHEKNTTNCFRLLESHIRKYFQVKAIANTWSSQYYESADGLPYVGKLPGHSPRVLTATGFGGNGMTYSAVAARVLRNIVVGQEDGLIELLSPSRIKPVAGFKNFATNSLSVARNLVSKIFKSSEIDQFAGIAPGEGAVAKVEDEKVAIFKDEQGSLHAANATCTHMGCSVTWNHAERSWDCPCHGARFDVDGGVLNGPAVDDLEFINVEIAGVEKA